MSKSFLHILDLHFSYPESIHPLFEGLKLSLGEGWTALTGENGGGKTSLLKLIAGEIQPSQGKVRGPDRLVFCRQSLEGAKEALEGFFEDFYARDELAGRLFALLGLDHDWPWRWESLSYGERKRAQIASALVRRPEVLLLDEPGNHLDEEALDILIPALAAFEGIGLLVSHQRRLLNSLCQRTLVLTGGRVEDYPGNWDQASEAILTRKRSQEKEYELARREAQRLGREVQRRKELADRHQKDFSKKGLSHKDSDAKAKIDLKRLTGRDAVGGRLVKEMEKRLDSFKGQMPQGPGQKKMGISVSGAEFRADRFFHLEAQFIPFSGSPGQADEEGGGLWIPELELAAGEKLAIMGPNGSGKSSLIRLIRERLVEAGIEHLYLPQEIDPEESAQVLTGLGQSAEQGSILSAFSRLGGNVDSLRQHPVLSPGETRKLLVAQALQAAYPILILDEPTNHMDLPSIQALEDALEQSTAALLFVSHDPAFRDRLCQRRWMTRPRGNVWELLDT